MEKRRKFLKECASRPGVRMFCLLPGRQLSFLQAQHARRLIRVVSWNLSWCRWLRGISIGVTIGRWMG